MNPEYSQKVKEKIASLEKVDGFLARLLQHEYDHPQGVLNIDIAESNTLEVMISDPTKETLRSINLDNPLG